MAKILIILEQTVEELEKGLATRAIFYNNSKIDNRSANIEQWCE